MNEEWRKTYTLNHKAAMDAAFKPAKTCATCHVCRHAKSPEKPAQPFTCGKSLPMDVSRCEAFTDARKPAFDWMKVYG